MGSGVPGTLGNTLDCKRVLMGGGNIVMSSFWASKLIRFITAPPYTRSLTVLNRKPKLNGPQSAETRPHILKKVAAMLGFFAFGDAGSGVTASRFHGLGFWGVGLQSPGSGAQCLGHGTQRVHVSGFGSKI